MSYHDIPGWFSEENVAFYQQEAVSIKNGKIVEIGTFAGRSAISIGHICQENNTELYCVDHWNGSPEYREDVAIHVPVIWEMLQAANWPYVFETFVKNVDREGLGNTVRIIKKSSLEAAALFEQESIDLVFIDAEHAYEAVKTDITTWLPLVKPGGAISGHDYIAANWSGVVQAVDEILPLANKGFDGIWWYRKPRYKACLL